MFRNPLVQRAWKIRQKADGFPSKTILKAALWLEGKHQSAPHWRTAAALALHYLVLAMHRELRPHPEQAWRYFSRALRWDEEAWRLCHPFVGRDL